MELTCLLHGQFIPCPECAAIQDAVKKEDEKKKASSSPLTYDKKGVAIFPYDTPKL